jgi:Tol biopolymer transport system component
MRRIVLLLSAMAAALLLASGVGLLNTVKPAQATFPGVNGRIAYTEDDDFSQDEDCCDDEIYTINADGTSRFRVTNNTTDDFWPSYSPDVKRIAYVGYYGSWGELFKIPVRGDEVLVKSNSNSPYGTFFPSWGSSP